MTVDIANLKALAEAAPEGPWFGPEYAPGTIHVFDVDLGTLLAYESIDSEKDACLRYVAAANPAAVLALIADSDRNAKNAAEWEAASLHWMADRDQLKALLIYTYNRGYMAGHHDTVEGQFADIHQSDMRTYHHDAVAEIVVENEPLSTIKKTGDYKGTISHA